MRHPVYRTLSVGLQLRISGHIIFWGISESSGVTFLQDSVYQKSSKIDSF